MIDASKTKLLLLKYSLILYFLLFFFNLIYVTIMIERPEGIFLSDILLWLHIIFVLVSYVYIIRFQKRPTMSFVVSIYKRWLVVLLMLHIIYFISVYLQSYLLIDETLIIIRDKILRGNPALILNFSNVNYTTLSYVVSLLQSVNSPLIILFMSLWTMRFYYTANASSFVLIEEETKRYDDFLYSIFIPIIWFILMIASFLSINLLTLNYTFVESIEMVVSILLFMVSFVGYVVSIMWYQTKNKTVKPSHMTHLHHYLFKSLFPISVLIIGLLMYHILTDYMTYRIYSVGVSGISVLLLWVFHLRLKRLD